MKLNLACGRDYREGWINIDNRQMYGGGFPVNMQADIFELEWEENSVDCILVNHFIQYVTPRQMEVLLKRWYSWLKHGGSIYIEAGDIKAVARKILACTSISELHGKDGVLQLYGEDDNIWNKWAWCPESLNEVMTRVGFKHLFAGVGYFHKNPYRDFLTVGYKVEEGQEFIPLLVPELLK